MSIYAWRAWRISDPERPILESVSFASRPRLNGVTALFEWDSRRTVAECPREHVEPGHAVPDSRCSCGLYATRTPELPLEYLGVSKIVFVSNFSAHVVRPGGLAIDITPGQVFRVSGQGWFAYARFGGQSVNIPPLVPPITILGIAELWGRIIPHERGFRAQCGRPVALTTEYLRGEPSPLAALGLPIFPSVEALAREFGLAL